MGLSLLTAPASEPVTLTEAKLHLRVEHSADDTLITALIATARQAAEHRIAGALISQQWRLTLDAWPDSIELPHPPLNSVEAITYLDDTGTRQTLAESSYQIITDTTPGSVQPAYGATWPTARSVAGSIRIDYTAGYATAAAVPPPIKAWMLLAIGTWYAQREASAEQSKTAELPRAFWDGLLDPYRLPGI